MFKKIAVAFTILSCLFLLMPDISVADTIWEWLDSEGQIVSELSFDKEYKIRVSDEDLDGDSYQVEILEINLLTENGDIEDFVATETAVDSGVFETSFFPVEYSDLKSGGDGKLQLSSNEGVDAEYSLSSVIETYNQKSDEIEECLDRLDQCYAESGDCEDLEEECEITAMDISDSEVWFGGHYDTVYYGFPGYVPDMGDATYGSSYSCGEGLTPSEIADYFNTGIPLDLEPFSWDVHPYSYEDVGSYCMGDLTGNTLEDWYDYPAEADFCFNPISDNSMSFPIDRLPEYVSVGNYVFGWNVAEYIFRIDHEVDRMQFFVNAFDTRGLETTECNDLYFLIWNSAESQWQVLDQEQNIPDPGGEMSYLTMSGMIYDPESYIEFELGPPLVFLAVAGYDVLEGTQPGSSTHLWNLEGQGIYDRFGSGMSIQAGVGSELAETGSRGVMVVVLLGVLGVVGLAGINKRFV